MKGYASNFRKIEKGVAIWLILIVFYVALLTVVFCIPRSRIQNNVESSLEILKEEGEYPTPFFHIFACKLDNVADEILIRIAEQPDHNQEMSELIVGDHSMDTYIENWDGSPLEKAMVGGYARYWHGYEVFLRPLLVVTDYSGVRYFNMIVFFLLMAACLLKVCERIGKLQALGFLLSLLMVYAFVIPMNMEFVSVFLILFAAVWILLNYYDRWTVQPERFAWFFLVVGSITNFMDFLTVPLITLGIPLLFWGVLERRRNATGKAILIKTVGFSVIWGISYALTWFAKWTIASIVLKRNVIHDAISSILLRTGAGAEQSVNLGEMLINNVGKLFGSDTSSMIFKVFLLIILVMGVYLLKRHKPWKVLWGNMPLLVPALYPFAWYMVLSNHSYIHPYFTYRGLIITLLSAWLFWAEGLEQRRSDKPANICYNR